MVLNNQMIMNNKHEEYGRKFSMLKLRFCLVICLEGLNKNYESLRA
jgi:hypothetical protein